VAWEGKSEEQTVPWVAGSICFEAGAEQPHPSTRVSTIRE